MPKHLSKILATLIVLALIIGPAYYFYDKYQDSQMLLQNPEQAAQHELNTLVAKIGTHLELPNETPTIATVSDKEKLTNQAFFQNAENGDKVLIYTEARKAILYRPSTDKVIEVSTVNLGEQSQAETPVAEPVEITAAIYNGSETVGITAQAEVELTKTVENLVVTAKENAARSDYEKSIVVALVPERAQDAQTLANLLSAEVSTLPEGEAAPADTDVLIILGNDYVQN